MFRDKYYRPHRGWLTTLLLAATLPSQADITTFAMGSDSSNGKYGQDSPTRMRVDYLSLSHDSESFTHKLVLPWLHIAGPAAASAQSDLSLLPADSAARERSSGLGDLLVGSTWKAWEADHQAIDLGLKLKLPTGDQHHGLSTGKADLSTLISAYQRWGKTSLLGSAGYKQVGKPDSSSYRNTYFSSAGIAYRVNAEQQWGISYDWAQSALRSQGLRRELTLYGSQRLDRQWQMQAWLYTGFTPASPDFGGGMGLAYRF